MQVICNLYATVMRDSDTMLTTGAGGAVDVEPDGSGGRGGGGGGRGASARGGRGGRGVRPGGGALAEEGKGLVGVEQAKMPKVRLGQGLSSLGCQDFKL